MKRLLIPLVLLAGALLLPSGCGGGVGAVVVTGLQVELTSIQRHADGTAVADLRVVNPNISSYLVAGVMGRVYLNGTLAGTINLRDAIGIPQQDSAVRSAALVPAGPGTAQLLADAERQGPVNYRLDATLLIQLYGEEKVRGDVTHSGTVTVTNK